MKNKILKKISLLVLLVFPALFSVEIKAQNPIIQTIYTADPASMVYKDTLFLYTGHDEDKSTWFIMKNWHVYSTTDMINWTDRGECLSLKNFKWTSRDAWAGQCIERNGKFYWYVPMNQANGRGMAVGVAVSDKPTGPFKDALGKYLVTTGWGDIDPTVFIDDDGQAYLYWGNPNLYYVKLNKDMVSYDQTLGIVKVPLNDESFKLRIINAHKTFTWAKSIDGLNAHTVKGSSGKYYWYVCATDKNTNKKVIGVAVGDNAIGPFTDILNRPLINEHCEEADINPTVVFMNNKQPFLTWGKSELWHVKLNSDMTSYDEAAGIQPVPAAAKEWVADRIKGAANSTEKRHTTYEEGPWLYKRNNLYYLFYPAGGVPEHLAYSTSKSLTDPQWIYGDTVMAVIKKGGAFTNHPAIVDFKGKTYLFYHDGALTGGGGFDRSVCVDELNFNPDGSVKRVEPTDGLKKGVGNLNPFTKVKAATIAWEEVIETATDSLTRNVYVTDINNGDYIKVRNVDFRKGAKSFQASVASATGGSGIEIRLDNKDGILLGTCSVKATGSMQNRATFSCPLRKTRGIHDVYFLFRGGAGNLFNFDWWKMNP